MTVDPAALSESRPPRFAAVRRLLGHSIPLIGSRFVRNVGETVANRVVSSGLSFIVGILVARRLGPVGRGEYSLAMTAIGLITQFGTLGLHSANTYFLGRDRDRLPKLFANSMYASVGTGLLAGLVVSTLWFTDARLLPLSGNVTIVVVVSAPISIAYLLFQYLALGLQKVRAYNIIDISQRVLGIAAIGVLFGVGVFGVASVTAVLAGGLTVGCLALAWRLHRIRRLSLSPSGTLMRSTFSYGARAYIAALGSYVVVRSDVLLVSHYLGLHPTGIYSTAVALVDLLLIFPTVVAMLLFARSAAVHDPEERWRTARRVATVTAVAMTVIAAAAALVAPTAITILYGYAFIPAVEPFRLILPGVVALAVSTVLLNYLAAIGMPPIAVIAPWTAGLLNVVMNVLLLRRYGVDAASVDTSIAYVLMLVLNLTWFWLRHPTAKAAHS